MIASGAIPLCDSETDEDLDAIVAAVAGVVTLPLLVGTSALAAALARAMPVLTSQEPGGGSHGAPADVALARRMLAVVGTAAPGIRAQLESVARSGVPVIRLDPEQVVRQPALARAEVAAARSGARLVVAVDPDAPLGSVDGRALAAALAEAVLPVAVGADTLFLTGGETARVVLDRLGLDRLSPLWAGPGGLVAARTPDQRLVLTRPGSLGTPDSLRNLLWHQGVADGTLTDPSGQSRGTTSKET